MQAVLLKAIGGVVGDGSPKEDGWVQFQLDREAAALAAKERLQAAAEAAAEPCAADRTSVLFKQQCW